ncbi:MAG: hypothetical protein ACOYMD_11255 [Paludibacter sp.]
MTLLLRISISFKNNFTKLENVLQGAFSSSFDPCDDKTLFDGIQPNENLENERSISDRQTKHKEYKDGLALLKTKYEEEQKLLKDDLVAKAAATKKYETDKARIANFIKSQYNGANFSSY